METNENSRLSETRAYVLHQAHGLIGVRCARNLINQAILPENTDPLEKDEYLRKADSVLTMDNYAKKYNFPPDDRVKYLEGASTIYAIFGEADKVIDSQVKVEEVLESLPIRLQMTPGKEYPDYHTRVEKLLKINSTRNQISRTIFSRLGIKRSK